jgi:hypothetical protein
MPSRFAPISAIGVDLAAALGGCFRVFLVFILVFLGFFRRFSMC